MKTDFEAAVLLWGGVQVPLGAQLDANAAREGYADFAFLQRMLDERRVTPEELDTTQAVIDFWVEYHNALAEFVNAPVPPWRM